MPRKAVVRARRVLLVGLIGVLVLGPASMGMEATSPETAPEIVITGLGCSYFSDMFGSCNLNLSPMIFVTWQVIGGIPPVRVWLSYTTPSGQTQKFGPFSWPEESNFVLIVALSEGGLLRIKVRAEDREGALSEHERGMPLDPRRPPFLLPPHKPIVSIIYDTDLTLPFDDDMMTIQATLINNDGMLEITGIMAAGCTVRSVQPKLPLPLAPGESKPVTISLRCPREGGADRVRLFASFLRPSLPEPPTFPPRLVISPSGGATRRTSVKVRATITNTTATALVAKMITSTGCTLRRVRPRLPLTLAPFESKRITVSLARCQRAESGWAGWTLSVVEESANVSEATPLAFREPIAIKRLGGFSFAAFGTDIESLKLEVFDLTGRKLYDSGFVAGPALSWNPLANKGSRAANGVYLYVVTVRGFHGEMFRSQVKKLVLLR